MATHTPGSWEWKRYVGGDAEAERFREVGIEPTMNLNNKGGTFVTAPDTDEARKLVAVVVLQADVKKKDAWRADDPERDANARLIAASPALLAAAENARLYLQEVGVREDAGGNALLADLDAAIAKATA